ncbi:MAG: hypothetical protein IPO04_20640 [Cytophagaceae bacterium]|nr:hypothetical protein [Cytophagaceae bacterium]
MFSDQKQNFTKQGYFKATIILLSILAYYFYSFGRYDLPTTDEDVFLNDGINLILPMANMGNLLYLSWIKILSFFISDPLKLIFTNFFLLSVIVFVLLIFFLNKYLKSFYTSFYISLLFLFSGIQISIFPKITFLNLVITLSTLILIDPKRKKSINLALLTLGFLLNIYVSRPEYLWIFPFVFLAFVFFAKKEKKLNTVFYLAGLLVLLFIAAGGIYPKGMLKANFIMHFFDNYEKWTGKHLDLNDEFIQFENLFGKVNYEVQLLTSNPTMFLKHVLSNMEGLSKEILIFLKSIFYDVFLSVFKEKTKYFAAAFVFYFLLAIDFKASIKKIRLPKPDGYLVLIFLPALLLILIVFPRQHFVLLLMPLVLLAIGFLTEFLVWRKQLKLSPYLISVILLIGLTMGFPFKSQHPNNVDFYKKMKELGERNTLVLLSHDDFGFNYYKTNYRRFSWTPEKDNIDSLAKKHNADIICLFRLDMENPSSREFLKQNHEGYLRVSKFDTLQRYIWVKPGLVTAFK